MLSIGGAKHLRLAQDFATTTVIMTVQGSSVMHAICFFHHRRKPSHTQTRMPHFPHRVLWWRSQTLPAPEGQNGLCLPEPLPEYARLQVFHRRLREEWPTSSMAMLPEGRTRDLDWLFTQ